MSDRAGGSREYRPDIDGLRAVAVLAVLLFHLKTPGFGGGYVGVDVFFVISGFLITGLILGELEDTGRFNFGRFYLRRARRLFPALFTTLAATFLIACLIMPPGQLRSFGASLAAAVVSLSNFWFWRSAGYFDEAATSKPLLHTWSLSVEEQFYLLWPLLLFLLWRVGRKRAAFSGLAAAAALSLLMNVDVGYFGAAALSAMAPSLARAFVDEHASLFYLLPFRVFELAIGGALCFLPSQAPRGIVAEAAVVIGAVAIAFSVVMFRADQIFPGVRALIPCLGAALLIWAGRESRAACVLRAPAPIRLGRISYSLYLVHWPLIVLFLIAKGEQRLSLFEQAGLALMSIALAGVLFTTVEQKWRAPKSPVLNRRFAWSAAAAAACIVIAGSNAYLSNGWAWRAGREAAALLDEGEISAKPAAVNPCFLGPSLTHADIAAECYSVDLSDPRPSILLFGDSTAEHLVSGFEEVFGGRFQILQYAASSCPPVLGYSEPDTPSCPENMRFFLDEALSRNHYDLVVISSTSRWDALASGLSETLRRIGVSGARYVVLGQLPYFKEAPPNIIGRVGAGDGLAAALSESLIERCDDNEHGVDQLSPPDRFISMKEIMCSDGAPIYQIGGRIIHKDHIHLNPRGSTYAAREIKRRLEDRGLLP